jgi:glycosyltransferase involved in cell wall biosynthesis
MVKPKIYFYANSAVWYSKGFYSGINRVTYELLESISKIEQIPYDFNLYTQGLKSRGGTLPFFLKKTSHLYFPNNMPFPMLFQYIPIREIVYNYDVFHIPHNFDYCNISKKVVVTLHDAMIYAYPKEFPNEEKRKKELECLLKKCGAILTCSQNSKNDILKSIEIKEEKIHVAPWGVNRVYYNEKKLNQLEYESVAEVVGNAPFFLSVSCGDGRKNTISVIKSYKKFLLNNPNHNLVLVWENIPNNIKKECESLEKNSRLIIIKKTDDYFLSLLYKAATALIFISKYEGFGLPILEAMACGTPVITCKNSSLTEIGGNVAIYVEPEDIENIVLVMEKFENIEYNKDNISKKCLDQSLGFTWDMCIAKTFSCYDSVLRLM